VGFGLGSAGEASRLGGNQGFRYTDNGYLSLLYQVGPFGFLMVAAAVAIALRRAWRVARRPDSPRLDLAILAMLVFLLVGMLAGDLLYGMTGVAFWYLLGLAVRREAVAH
jgi:O-antigen ligase